MSGMLAGVEAARRRRIHHKIVDGKDSSTIRSSVCLYFRSYFRDNRIGAATMPEDKKNRNGERVMKMNDVDCDDEKLDPTVREAKRRLDLKLHGHRKSDRTARNL